MALFSPDWTPLSGHNGSTPRVCRLQQEPEILEEYDRVIKEQLEKGIIEPVCDLESEGKLYYLPHHPVIRKDAKTTTLTVVYDASAKPGGKGVSLNDCLHVGPALTPMFYDVLIRSSVTCILENLGNSKSELTPLMMRFSKDIVLLVVWDVPKDQKYSNGQMYEYIRMNVYLCHEI